MTTATRARTQYGARITAIGLSTQHRGGAVALDNVSLVIEPATLTAIVGPSGAGKTTLLAALGGVAPAQQGTVIFDEAGTAHRDPGIGFVPQDDILHDELPLRRTLRYAARLRMAASYEDIDAAVDAAMATLGLTGQGDVPVHSLSGGQRKRANIAGEILTRPEVCFLDEPTSGLDPAVTADLIDYLHRMSAAGSTVVFTTHNISDIERSDRVIVLAPGGRLVAVGTPADVLVQLGEATFTAVYQRLTAWTPVTASADVPRPSASLVSASARQHRDDRPSARRQWWTLTRRAADILSRNRLTLAILLGSPAAVIAMFAVLFRPGAFNAGADPTGAIQVTYWLAFSGFFFGLTFGLLQVTTELSVLRRERYAGLRIGSYLLSKLALLTPVLLLVNLTMIGVLRALDRLPALSVNAFLGLNLTMALNSVAALCLGLLASAAVTSTAQAALALPMLCFPAVLFSGAMVPIPVMAGAGRAISAVMSDRWAFEAIGRHLHVSGLTPSTSPYAGLGASASTTYWALLAVFTLVTAVGAYCVVRRRAGSSGS
jgi:ABC-type multidrug transport system ATPase subunit